MSSKILNEQDMPGDVMDDVLSRSQLSTGDKDELIHNSSSPMETSPLHKAKKLLLAGKDKVKQQGIGLKLLVGATIAFSAAITVALVLCIYLLPPQVGPHGGVASDTTMCSEVGVRILQAGGSAVDAAIAASFCTGVVNPQSSGIGGGGFMLVHDHKNQRTEIFDFRETAPAAATKDMFNADPQLAVKGLLSSAVPGDLKGFQLAHSKYGSLSWKQIIQPSIYIARNGFNVTESLAYVLRYKINLDDMNENLKNFCLMNGNLLKEGDFVTRPRLADTLEAIAEEGSKAFYDGSLTSAFIKEIQDNGGIITKQDLADYRVVLRKAVNSTFNNYTILTMPAPGSGAIVLLILNILEGYNLTAADVNQTDTYHHLVEAFKFGYAHKASLADPGFVPDIANVTDYIISKKLAAEIRSKIDDKAHNDTSFYQQFFTTPDDKGTSHLSAVDATELFVAVTGSLNYNFGSKYMTSTGIILNNHMNDFSKPVQNPKIPSNPINFIEPGKRPLSSMSPTMVHSVLPCDLRIALGGANGSRIISGVSQVLMNILALNMTLKSAIEAPRLHAQLFPNMNVYYEEKVPDAIVTDLASRGNILKQETEGLSVVQAVLKINDTYIVHSDSRYGGKAAVY